MLHIRSSSLGLGLIALSASLLGGCATEDVDSSDIRTAGMHPIYTAVATGDGKTTVTGELRVGGDDGTYIVLVDGDELTASVEDDEKAMKGIDDDLRYQTSFGIDAGGTVFNVAFTREDSGDGNTNGPASFVTLPEPFELTLADLDAGAEIARGTDVAIEWDPPASGEVSWSVDGDCIFFSSGKTEDDGSFSIPTDEIDVTGTDEGESCEVTVTVERKNKGTIDEAFDKEGGSFWATQVRTIVFTSTPGPDEEES